MKRSEMLEHISAEMLEYLENRRFSLEADEKYYARKAKDLLDMLQGFGMLPPLNEQNYHYMDNEDRYAVNLAKSLYTWENEE